MIVTNTTNLWEKPLSHFGCKPVLALAISLLSSIACASPLTVNFAGTWTSQQPNAATLEPVTAVPVNFTAAFTFDPSIVVASPCPYGCQYVADFGKPSAYSSSVNQYTIANPFGTPAESTSVQYTRIQYGPITEPYSYTEGFSFANSLSANSGMGSQAPSYWSSGINLSYFLPVAGDSAFLFSAQDYMDILNRALASDMSFNAFYSNRVQMTYPSGYMDLFAAGYILYGTAKIVSINQVPEPQTIFLMGVGLVIAALTRKQRKAA